MAVQGMAPIPPPQGLLALERILSQRMPQVAVLPMDWLALSESFGHNTPPFLSLLINEARSRRRVHRTDTGEPTLLRQLTATPSQNRQHVLMDFMREQAGKVLRLEAAFHLDPKRPLNELGLDSLSAIELRNTLGRALGRPLPATLLFDYPTIDGLAGHLIHEIFAAPANGHDQEQAAGNGKSGERAGTLAEIEALSTDEIETMLAVESQAMASLIDGDKHE
jgi:acyl carrier protein